MKADRIEETIKTPEGVAVKKADSFLIVTGPKGEVKKRFKNPKVSVDISDGKVTFIALKPSKREKTLLFTFRAHIKNMFEGVVEPHVYKMKICSGHFPMNVAINGKDFVIKNFLGEKVPRVLHIKEGADVKIEGSEVIITSPDIEIAGQIAADIEQLTKVKNRDIRIFQDGIYIVEKSGKVLM